MAVYKLGLQICATYVVDWRAVVVHLFVRAFVGWRHQSFQLQVVGRVHLAFHPLLHREVVLIAAEHSSTLALLAVFEGNQLAVVLQHV